MRIEDKFRAYIATLDGCSKAFSTVEHLFEELYHSEFVLQGNDSIIDRKQMKQLQAKAFEMGSRATLLLCVASQDSIEYKFCLTNKHWNIVIHCVTEVKDGKLYSAQSVDGSNPILFRNIDTYIAAFDGTPKDFSEFSRLFEQIYHDDFVFRADGTIIGKKGVKDLEADFFALGSTVNLILLKAEEPNTVEFKYRIVNSKFDQLVHIIARVKDGQLVASEPIDQGTIDSVTNIRQVCQAYESDASAKSLLKLPLAENDQDKAVLSAPQ